MLRHYASPSRRNGLNTCSSTAAGSLVGILLVLTTWSACVTIPPFDPVSLEHATTLKADSLALLDKATDPPQQHEAAIAQLRQQLQQALEYEMNKPVKNTIAVGQWKLMIDPEGNLMGGFLKKWEAEQVGRSPEFVAGVKKLVGRAFDQIIQAENQKPKL